ncbi:Atxe2 family lasso peptide isopeptidase [Emcibacter nanhaiensis]|uniref:Atxe2 family lasso peptide isopeptidase n=1 Tax=Emcibacter nanhaiensis TaxID=1505037 RepID=UPI0015E28310|nr:Atxe2 family lasso peptide isopeptidase [Emcibacter nanhaiensis]
MQILLLLTLIFPDLSLARAVTTEDLLTIRDIKTYEVSPDGKSVAYQIVQADPEANTYKLAWKIMDIFPETDQERQGGRFLADGGEFYLPVFPDGMKVGEFVGTPAAWSPDSRWIAFTRKMDDAVQIWRVDREGGKVVQLTHSTADVENLKFSRDGRLLYFTVGRDRADVEREVNKENREGVLVQDDISPVYSSDVRSIWPTCKASQTSSGYEDLMKSDRHCELRVRILDVTSGKERIVTDKETENYFGNSTAFIETSKDTGQVEEVGKASSVDPKIQFRNVNPEIFKGFAPLSRLEVVVGGRGITCAHEACLGYRGRILRKFWWSPELNKVIFQRRDGSHHSLMALYAWSPETGKLRTIVRGDELLQDCRRREQKMICKEEGWTSPAKLVSIDLATGQKELLVDENPAFREMKFTKIEKLLSDDGMGNTAYGHLVYPANYEKGRAYPLVVVQYRSAGFLRGGTGDEVPIHALVQQGIMVLSFDMTDDLENYARTGDFLEMSAKHWSYLLFDQGTLIALNRILDKLVERGLVDPAHIGITGLSHGASTVEQEILFTDRFAAASAAYISSNPMAYYVHNLSINRKYKNFLFGGKPYVGESAAFSLGLNAGKINTPLLVQAADREFQLSMQNYTLLREAGKPVEMYIFPDAYHVKWQPAQRQAVYKRHIDWFKFWLQGKEDPDPVKQKQYRRWREMRKNLNEDQ